MTPVPTPSSAPSPAPVVAPAEIDFSCRLPLLVLFVSAAVWLVIASGFGLIASIKFHSPDFLANPAWLTYGRVRPAALDALLYGFCLQAGLGVVLWLLARLGQVPLAQRWLTTIGAMFWNLGVTVGIVGVLAGDSTGFAWLELPLYGAWLLFLGYLLLGIWTVITFARRRQRWLFPAQWFLLTALFWFPWIYSTAELLLVVFPVRGVAQSVIHWWFTENLVGVWLALVGLGVAFYFVPRITRRDLHSHYLALFTYWMLILCGSWGGVPNNAPVPAWLPVSSTIASVLMILPLLAVGLNFHRTLAGNYSELRTAPALAFIVFGVTAFLLAGFLKAFGALADTAQVLNFTWYLPGREQLRLYGFFAMAAFGAIYYILPRLTGADLPYPRLVRLHFWLASVGILLICLPLIVGGVVQAVQLQNPRVAFIDISKATLMFLRMSTVGDLLLLLGHLAFLGNLVAVVVRFYRSRALAVYAQATADLFKVEGVRS